METAARTSSAWRLRTAIAVDAARRRSSANQHYRRIGTWTSETATDETPSSAQAARGAGHAAADPGRVRDRGVVYIAGGEETDVTKPKARRRIDATWSKRRPRPKRARPRRGCASPKAAAARASTGPRWAARPTRSSSSPAAARRSAASSTGSRRNWDRAKARCWRSPPTPRSTRRPPPRGSCPGTHLEAGGPVHFLLGTEDELRGYWNAWGFDGPAAKCPESIPAHLVSGAGQEHRRPRRRPRLPRRAPHRPAARHGQVGQRPGAERAAARNAREAPTGGGSFVRGSLQRRFEESASWPER